MPGFEILEKLSYWPDSSFSYIFHSLPDAFTRIGACRYIQQALVSFCILNHRRRLAIHGKHDRPLLFLICFMKAPDLRRNVVRD
jgi:hypothetical protein